MWKCQVEREGGNPFFELLTLIGDRRNNVPEMLADPSIDPANPADLEDTEVEDGDEDYEAVTEEEICAFCGLRLTNSFVMDKHIQFCAIRLTFK